MSEARCMIRTFNAVPPEFLDQFVEGGWRRVERIYGARTSQIRKWIAMTGADVARRAAR
jgi:hypothetical protein